MHEPLLLGGVGHGEHVPARGDRVVLYSQGALQPDTRIRVVEQLLPAGGAK